MSQESEPQSAKEKKADEKTGFRSRMTSGLLKAALLPLLVALGTIISMCVPIPAPVEIKAEVRRVSLTAADSEIQALLPHTPVCSLDLGDFEEVVIPAASIRIADPARADIKSGKIPENAWRPWLSKKSLVLTPSSRFQAKIALKTLPDVYKRQAHGDSQIERRKVIAGQMVAQIAGGQTNARGVDPHDPRLTNLLTEYPSICGDNLEEYQERMMDGNRAKFEVSAIDSTWCGLTCSTRCSLLVSIGR